MVPLESPAGKLSSWISIDRPISPKITFSWTLFDLLVAFLYIYQATARAQGQPAPVGLHARKSLIFPFNVPFTQYDDASYCSSVRRGCTWAHGFF